MAVSVCPMDVAQAPIGKVWTMLLDSSQYSRWSDLEHPTITPPGPITPGQVFEDSTSELGLTFHVRLTVREVVAEHHRVGFDVQLPFGIHNAASISLISIGPGATRIAYG